MNVLRRSLFLALVPLDRINNTSMPVRIVTSCYFDPEINIWKPFDYSYV